MAVRDDNLGEQALCVSGEIIEVERNQGRANAHGVTSADHRVKAFAFQRHGIDPDVQQNLCAFRGAQRYRVPGRVQRQHLTIAWRDEHSVGWIDRRAIANHLLREDRIGNPLERPNDTRERRPQRDHTTSQFNGRNKSRQS